MNTHTIHYILITTHKKWTRVVHWKCVIFVRNEWHQTDTVSRYLRIQRRLVRTLAMDTFAIINFLLQALLEWREARSSIPYVLRTCHIWPGHAILEHTGAGMGYWKHGGYKRILGVGYIQGRRKSSRIRKSQAMDCHINEEAGQWKKLPYTF